MIIEIAQKADDKKIILICIHKMFTPESCFEGAEVLQHYFLEPKGMCMCGKVDFELAGAEIEKLAIR